MEPKPLKTFIIYSSKDRDLREELERHLLPLVDIGWLSLWSDKEILPGEHWDAAIKKQLRDAELFLMLISVDFYNSGYIREEEFKSVVQRLDAGDALVVPIIVRDCNWELFPIIKDLQVLPPGGYAVTDLDYWKTREKAWAQVVKKIAERVNALRTEREAAKTLHLEAERKRREAEAQRQPEVEVRKPQQFTLEALHLAWMQASEQDTVEGYENFLAGYPHGSFSVDAKTRIGQLRLKQNPPAPWQRYAGFASVILVLCVIIWMVTHSDERSRRSVEATYPLEKDANFPYEMVGVVGDTFTMGQPNPDIRCKGCSANECPHPVKVGNFAIGKYEVTQAQWTAIIGENPSRFQNCDNCPVESVSWDDIQIFLQKLNARLTAGQVKYRLPTEAEWEFAARDGKVSREYQYAGSNEVGKLAWVSDNADSTTHPVGRKQANEIGLYDMSGNVSEWCQDQWTAYPNCKAEACKNCRVARGGSWYDYPLNCRTAFRIWDFTGLRNYGIGFRLAR